jgi:hypothetical protein
MRPRHHRPVDGGPLRAGLPPGDRPCGVQVGGQTIAARSAPEMRPAPKVFAHDSALGAFSARVFSRDGDDFDSSTFGLVPDHRFQFSESPSVDLPIPSAAESLETVSDSGQVLQLDHGVLPNRLCNDGLGNAMVQVADIPTLPSAQPFQGAFCAFRAQALESLSSRRELLADVHGFSAGIERAFRSYGDVVNAAIHADDADRVGPLAWLVLDDDVDVPLTVSEYELCCGRLLSPQRIPLILAQDKRNMDAPSRSREGHGFLVFAVGKNAFVVVDARRLELLDDSALALRCLDRPRHAGDGADGQVGREVEPVSDFVVDKMLELDLVGGLLANGHGKDGITSERVLLDSILEGVSRYRSQVRFAYDSTSCHNVQCYILCGESKGCASSPL